jgi:hypothetical protein
MTHKIAMKVNQSDTPGADFAALADQLIQDSWHLPPGGDQSWREQDAARIFSGRGKDEINATDDAPSAVTEDLPLVEEEWPQEPTVKASRLVGVLLPVSLATIIMFFAVAFSMPELLTSHFRNAAAPKAGPNAQVTQVSMIEPRPMIPTPDASDAAPGKLRPSLMDGASAATPVHAAQSPQPYHAAFDAKRQAQQKISTVVRVATARSFRQPASRTKRIATRLPPIGAAYFASHTPAVAARKAPAADWNAETTKWDEMAAKIRAGREKYQTGGNTTLVDTRHQASREFP